MGTPEFAVPSLRALAGSHTIAGVITQPDRPSGRGRSLVPPPVRTAAEELGLEVRQPADVNSAASLDVLLDWKPDLICVAAFGQILSRQVLELPQAGCLNVHASLLPRWRGASPINAAILAGDSHTGVSIMKMGPGLDDGPIAAQEKVEIAPGDTAGTLSQRLAELGGDLLLRTIPPYLRGVLTLQLQAEVRATYARQLTKKDGELDFGQNAGQLARQVRAYSPWPGSYTNWQGTRLLVHQARAVGVTSPGVGVFTTYEDCPAVGTAAGVLVLEELQLAGKSRLSGKQFLNGTPSWGKTGAASDQN